MTPNNFPGVQSQGPVSLGGLGFLFCDVPLWEGPIGEGGWAPRLRGWFQLTLGHIHLLKPKPQNLLN